MSFAPLNRISAIVFCSALIAGAAVVPSAFGDDLFTDGMSDEEKGHAVAVAADLRDLGFGDSSADLKMVLTNRSGATSERELRIRALEMPASDVGDKSLVIFDRPRDVKGTAMLTYSKILEPDDQWMYLPALKRVKRISSVNKSGPFMGSEFAFEDMSSQEVGKYTYKYLREEACGELTCHVIERIPAYQYSGYTRQVVWFDTEHLRSMRVDFYDRKADLLKTLTFEDYRQYLDKFWRAHDLNMVNHQTGKTSRLLWQNYRFQSGQDARDFTETSLRRAG